MVASVQVFSMFQTTGSIRLIHYYVRDIIMSSRCFQVREVSREQERESACVQCAKCSVRGREMMRDEIRYHHHHHCHFLVK